MPRENFNEVAKDAVTQAIAAEVLKSVGEENRDEILRGAVTEALKSWNFKSAVEKAVAAEAESAAYELLASEKYQKMIGEAVQRGVEHYIKQLEAATTEMVADVMHGAKSPGGSSYPSTISRYLKSAP